MEALPLPFSLNQKSKNTNKVKYKLAMREVIRELLMAHLPQVALIGLCALPMIRAAARWILTDQGNFLPGGAHGPCIDDDLGGRTGGNHSPVRRCSDRADAGRS